MRLPTSEGGWFKMWGLKWLTDSKLRAAGDMVELAYVRLMCLSNVNFKNGLFIDVLGRAWTEEEICRDARISEAALKSLISHGFLAKDPVTGAYLIPKWERYQAPTYKKFAAESLKTQEKQKEKPKASPASKRDIKQENIEV